MSKTRIIHPDFMFYLKDKDQVLIDLYLDLRSYILSFHEEAIELLYHTHALTSLYTVSEKMSDGYCMIPIYTNHMNLGFSKGTILHDPEKLLQGTGKLIRHIPVKQTSDYRNEAVKTLIQSAIELAIEDRSKVPKQAGITISKIKRSK